MNKSTVSKKFKEIVADIFRTKITQLKDDTDFVNDLNAKSVDMIALIAATENEFGIRTNRGETNKNTTIKESVDYVWKKLQAKKPTKK